MFAASSAPCRSTAKDSSSRTKITDGAWALLWARFLVNEELHAGCLSSRWNSFSASAAE